MGAVQPRTAVAPVKVEDGIEQRIHVLRGERVMLDADLAALYGVTTGRLNEAVRRNRARFPSDFMFRLTSEEAGALRSQFAISNTYGRGGRRYLPYAFTEQGVAMLSSVLNSRRAVAANILIMRTFVHLRRAQGQYAELRQQILEVARTVQGHDELLGEILRALEALAQPAPTSSRRIGFQPPPSQRGDPPAEPDKSARVDVLDGQLGGLVPREPRSN
jgi:hypothetical protein